MKTTYTWAGPADARTLTVKNLHTGKSITIKKADGVRRVTGSKLYGAIDNDELLVAKIVADRNGDVDAIAKWLTNATDADRVQAMVDALIAEKLAAMNAKLRAAGIDPDAE